ncbi:hypothetical protein HMPREF9069_00987 [Atopobium sp. oral taxon 810 str. F0209]|nr:hypothetical protein HMPREF9069_00987 [Atopobium sp. oral taxon 810 str. F0209]
MVWAMGYLAFERGRKCFYVQQERKHAEAAEESAQGTRAYQKT